MGRKRPAPSGRLGTDPSAHVFSTHLTSLYCNDNYVRKSKNQEIEYRKLQEAFLERLYINKRVHDLKDIHTFVDQEIPIDHHIQIEQQDCFATTKSLIEKIDQKSPTLRQLLEYLVQNMEALVHEKLQQESRKQEAINKSCPRKQQLISDKLDEEEDKDFDETSTSDGSCGQEQKDAQIRNKRNPTQSTFRRVKRNRNFPPTRIPCEEYVVKTYEYMPLDAARHPSCDIQSSISLKVTDTGTQMEKKWQVVEFPKKKPTLNQEQVQLLNDWAKKKVLQTSTTGKNSTQDTFVNSQATFKQQVLVNEIICYEMCRLVYDTCPTTACFLHGLFQELTAVALRTVQNSTREMKIANQREKNALSELKKLGIKIEKDRRVLEKLNETMDKRQHALLSEKDRIVRKRKKMNLLLCADQTLMRHVGNLLERVLEASTMTKDDPHSKTINSNTGSIIENISLPCLQEIYELVVKKYGHLDAVKKTHERLMSSPSERTISSMRQQQLEGQSIVDMQRKRVVQAKDVIILEQNDLRVATEEIQLTLKRLNRLVTSQSPDHMIGWDPEKVWHLAMFIPSYEDIEDLEIEVHELCQFVEKSILTNRMIRPLKHHVVVQTDVSSFHASKHHPRVLARQKTSKPLGSKHHHHHHHQVEDEETRQDARELYEELPLGFRKLIDFVSSYRYYKPQPFPLEILSGMISYFFNEMLILIQQEQQNGTLKYGTTFHEYLYRIYLVHFQVPEFAHLRILDLLHTISRLDTQSYKVLLFCRLLQLPGVDVVPEDTFWFVLRTIQVLQRSTSRNGGYFLLDEEEKNEYVPLASVWEAINILFAKRINSNEVMKRIHLKMTNISSEYGTVWIPAYTIINMILEEWLSIQKTLRQNMEQTAFHVMESYLKYEEVPPPNLSEFKYLMMQIPLVINGEQSTIPRSEITKAYKRIVVDSRNPSLKENVIDVSQFFTQTLEFVWNYHILKQKQYYQYYMGPLADSMIEANAKLSLLFLKATWNHERRNAVALVDAKVPEIGARVRLLQHMESIFQHDERVHQDGWKTLHQLIQVVFR